MSNIFQKLAGWIRSTFSQSQGGDEVRSAQYGQHSSSLPSMGDDTIGIVQLDDSGRPYVHLDAESLSDDLDVNINSDSLTGNLDVNLNSDSLTNNLDVDIAEASASPLDVSGAEVDIDLNSQTLRDVQAKIRGEHSQSLPSLSDGTLGVVQLDSSGRPYVHLDAESLSNDLDVNLNTDSLTGDLDVNLNTDSLSGDLDVDLNSQTLGDVQAKIRGEHSSSLPSLSDGSLGVLQIDSNGRPFVHLDAESLPDDLDVNLNSDSLGNDLDINLNSDSLSGNLDVDIAEASGSPLDVSASELDVNLNTDSLANPLDVDIAEASSSPLDVSASELDVDINSQTLRDVQTKIRGEHSSSLPTLSDGTLGTVQLDDKGRLLVNLDTEIAGEDLGNDVQMTRLKLDDGNQNFDFVEQKDGAIKSSVVPEWLQAEDSITSGPAGTETTFSGWTDPDGNYLPTVTINSSTYLDVRHLSYLGVRGTPSTTNSTTFKIYALLSRNDSEKVKASPSLNTQGTTEDIGYFSVEAPSFIRVTADYNSDVYVGGAS